MRYINNQNLRRLANLDDIEAANKAIAKLATDAERSDFIDHRDNQAKWSAIRDSLWTAGCAKCWYSEAHLQQQEGQVEHFRPKKRLHGATHGGYWWRAFDWTNFRLAHPTVNRRVTDYLSGNKAGKGSYFPLLNENERATCAADENKELPVLLDPTNQRIANCCALILKTAGRCPDTRSQKMQTAIAGQKTQSITFISMRVLGIIKGKTSWTMLRHFVIE